MKAKDYVKIGFLFYWGFSLAGAIDRKMGKELSRYFDNYDKKGYGQRSCKQCEHFSDKANWSYRPYSTEVFNNEKN